MGGPGAGTSSGFWVRFVMLEGVGVWAMEFMHTLTGFGDLYPFGGNMGNFDEMVASGGTHPSAYTKAAIKWLDASAMHATSTSPHSPGRLPPRTTPRHSPSRDPTRSTSRSAQTTIASTR
jgi:hypothetical protein